MSDSEKTDVKKLNFAFGSFHRASESEAGRKESNTCLLNCNGTKMYPVGSYSYSTNKLPMKMHGLPVTIYSHSLCIY